MLSERWCLTQSQANTGESNENIVARSFESGILLAYSAYGEIKLMEVSGVVDFCMFEETGKTVQDVVSEVGDDYEVALPVIVEGKAVIIAVDSMDELRLISDKEISVMPDVLFSAVMDEDELEAFIKERKEFDGVYDALGL